MSNNIILCCQVISSSCIDGIWMLVPDRWDPTSPIWIYEPRLENLAITRTKVKHTCHDESIAEVLSENKDERAKIISQCENSVKRMKHYMAAKDKPIQSAEQNEHPGVPMRRCPGCLKSTSSRMTYCLCCDIEFMGNFLGRERRSTIRGTASFTWPDYVDFSYTIPKGVKCSSSSSYT